MHHYSRLLANRITIAGEHELWDSLLGDHGDTTITIRHGGYCPCGRYVPVGNWCESCLDAAESLMPTRGELADAFIRFGIVMACMAAVVWAVKVVGG